MLQKRFGSKDSVRCSEFRGGRFSEVANVLQVWDFQSMTRTLIVRSRGCVHFSECPLREVLLYTILILQCKLPYSFHEQNFCESPTRQEKNFAIFFRDKVTISDHTPYNFQNGNGEPQRVFQCQNDSKM